MLIIIFAIAAVVIGWKTGYLYGGTKEPKQKVIIYAVACDSGIVDRYNESVSLINIDGGQDRLDSLINEIKSNPDHVDDATCQMILFLSANRANDSEAMRAAFEPIQQLNSRGIFPNNNIIGIMPLMVMEQLVAQNVDPISEMLDNANGGE